MMFHNMGVAMEDVTQVESEVCPHCGAKMVKYWHRLNRPLCQALELLAKTEGKSSRNGVHLRNSGLFTHEQMCNIQKLVYWGMVVKGRESGAWSVTDVGRKFVAGKLRVREGVQTYRGTVLGFRGKRVAFSEVGDVRWRKLDDYAGGK